MLLPHQPCTNKLGLGTNANTFGLKPTLMKNIESTQLSNQYNSMLIRVGHITIRNELSVLKQKQKFICCVDGQKQKNKLCGWIEVKALLWIAFKQIKNCDKS